MKKILSLTVLSALVITSGVCAQGFWQSKGAKLGLAFAAISGSVGLYSQTKMNRNRAEKNKASTNAFILKSFLGKIYSAPKCQLIGQPGTLEQIEALDMTPEQRITLINAIEAYDNVLRADANYNAVAEAAENLKSIIKPHLDCANMVIKKSNNLSEVRDLMAFGAGYSLAVLAVAYGAYCRYDKPLQFTITTTYR